MITIGTLPLTLALTVLFISPLVIAIFPLLYLIVVLFGPVLSMPAIVCCRRQMLMPTLVTSIWLFCLHPPLCLRGLSTASSWLGIPIFGSDFWDSWIPILFPIPDVLSEIYFWNSDFWKVRKSKFWFAKLWIPVICRRRNSLHLIIANLYWFQSMYNNSILMVHKLATPLQHQTAELVQNHIISHYHSCIRATIPGQ